MPSYSLIEYKLRRYFYLGHEYSIYVPPGIRKSYWEQRHHEDISGVRIIGKIVKKNKIEEINSIVPIILKIKKENKLLDDKLLIYALAICAKFNLKQCEKLVSDAYGAVTAICSDGLRLLMFVHFCHKASSILHNEGFVENPSSGFGNGFRKALNKWYLDRDPLLSAEQILRYKSYEGWTHKDIMKLIHIHSDNPSYQIFIIHTMHGIAKVEELFGSKLKNVKIHDDYETFENKQLKFIYNKFNQVHDIAQMDESTLRYEIELRRWGHEHQVIPKKMLNSPKILTSLVMHLPLRILLDNTFFFARKRLFRNSTPDTGLWEFILRFNNPHEVKKWRIHPIESYLAYVRYSRTSQNILKIQNNILKKQGNSSITLPPNKLKVAIGSQNLKNSTNDSATQITNKTSKKLLNKNKTNSQQTVNTRSKLFQGEPSNSKEINLQQIKNTKKCNTVLTSTEKDFKSKKSKQKSIKPNPKKSNRNQINNQTKLLETSPFEILEKNKEEQNQPSEITDQLSTLSISVQQKNPESNTIMDEIQTVDGNENQNQLCVMTLLKPPPKLSEQLITFLSKDLIKKSLEVLNPIDQRIIIAYDSRVNMKKKMCFFSDMLNVHEAITLITLSLIYPNKIPNKPTICGLDETGKPCKNDIKIDYEKPLTYENLNSILFQTPVSETSDADEKDIPDVNPLTTMNWAKENNKEYDVFVFLGTNKMNLKNINGAIKEYQEFLKKRIKIVICCLNGKHFEQRNLGRGNRLFIAGFDKNVGKIIESFMNEEF